MIAILTCYEKLSPVEKTNAGVLKSLIMNLSLVQIVFLVL